MAATAERAVASDGHRRASKRITQEQPYQNGAAWRQRQQNNGRWWAGATLAQAGGRLYGTWQSNGRVCASTPGIAAPAMAAAAGDETLRSGINGGTLRHSDIGMDGIACRASRQRTYLFAATSLFCHPLRSASRLAAAVIFIAHHTSPHGFSAYSAPRQRSEDKAHRGSNIIC